MQGEASEFLKDNMLFISMLNTLNNNIHVVPFFSPYYDMSEGETVIKLHKVYNEFEIENEVFKNVSFSLIFSVVMASTPLSLSRIVFKMRSWSTTLML